MSCRVITKAVAEHERSVRVLSNFCGLCYNAVFLIKEPCKTIIEKVGIKIITGRLLIIQSKKKCYMRQFASMGSLSKVFARKVISFL